LAGSTRAVPASVVEPVLTSLIRSSSGSGLVEEAGAIFAHNVLAFALAAVLAVVTLGATGFVLTFAPGFLVGFAAAASSWTVALTGILPNGLVEIPAAIVAGGLAIQIGATAIHMDAGGGWARRVAEAFADYVRALRWLVPGLAVAAVLEVWLG
ncbi:MAG TPA: stage II sporulation protein M, partial [Candidatus Sulfotelmatobacter sp.]|nr:stage II sporulation protein M [Candidatus Sulfotelmatobacter sp.]